ncbi:MAG: COG1361 S-layer family protein [Anaerocolumna sp.]
MKLLKKVFVTVLAVTMMISNLAGGIMNVKADDAVAIVFAEKVDDIVGVPGETVHVKLPIKASGGFLSEPRISVVTEDMPYTVKNIALTAPGYTPTNPPISISNTSTSFIEFDLLVKETAKISTNKLIVKVNANYYDYSDVQSTSKSKEFTLPNLNVVISNEKEPAQLTVDNVTYGNAVIGGNTTINFTIKNEGEITAKNAYFSVDHESLTAAGLIPDYSKLEQKIGTGVLAAGETYTVKLPFKVSKEAKEGSKTLTINMSYKNEDGESSKDTSQIYVTISKNSNSPVIEILSTKYATELKAGDKFNLVTTIKNVGNSTAKSIEVTVDGLGLQSFLPGYTTKSISVKDVGINKTSDIRIPLIVSNEATLGLKEVPITITYKEDSGVSFETKITLYLEIESAEGVDATGKPNIVISNVSQNPEMPNGGGRVDVSFDLENKSTIDVTDLKLAIIGGDGSNFSPLSSEPYIYIEKLEAGKKARITLPIKASETIPEGTNSLQIQYEYKDAKGETVPMSSNATTLYIQNVQNSGVGSSKPKLIISNFTADAEELKAGSTFKFIFDITNTHTNVDARNIKVTISQADNIFSVENGSNTFYIEKILAGETLQYSLDLKVKSDATTKAYPLEITMEYDYEGAEANPTTGQIGETAKETINLQAVENTRPVVDNIVVGSWESPTVNQSTILTFQFYNLGKSTLNNVQASIEGDYTLSTGSMFFIGNVESGSQEYAELEVIPNVEGIAKGTLVVSFEDSNGEPVTITKEFEGTIMGEYIPDMGDGGMIDGGIVVEQPKAPIVQLWLFIIIQIVIVVICIPVSRKIVLQLYRRKLRKQEEVE